MHYWRWCKWLGLTGAIDGESLSKLISNYRSTRGQGHNRGCFAQRSQLMHLPCKLLEEPDGKVLFIDPYRSEGGIIDRRDVQSRSALCTRAWTLQEQLLCPRILYFGAILKWECCECIEWELPYPYREHLENQNAKKFILWYFLWRKEPWSSRIPNSSQTLGQYRRDIYTIKHHNC